MRSLLSLLLVLAAAPAAAQDAVEVRLPEVSVRPGAEVVVPITVETSLTGRDVRAVTVVLRYASPAVTALAVETDGTMAADLGSVSSSVDPVAREVRLAAAGAEPLAGTGVLFNVRFRGETPGSVSVTFDAEESALNEGDPPLTFTDGRVTVETPPTVRLSPGSAVLLRGETAAFTASGGAAPYAYATLDPTVATVDAEGLVTARAAGTTRLSATDADGTPSSTQPLVDVRAFDLSTAPVDAGQGETVVVPLLVTSLDGLDVRSGEIVLRLAASVARIVGVETAGTLLDGASVTLGTEGDRSRIAFASGAVVTGGGTLLTLLVETAPGGNGTASFSTPEVPFVNEDRLGLARGLGTVRVSPPPSLAVSPPTPALLAGESIPLTAGGAAGAVTWDSTDPAVATVSAAGVLTGVGSGTTTITATDAETGGAGTATVTVYGVEIAPGEVSARPGETARVPVAFRSPAGEPIESIEARFHVDAVGVTAVDVDATGRLAAGWSFSRAVLPDGSLRVAGAGPAVASDGVLFDLVAEVASVAALGGRAVRVVDLLFNEGRPTARTQTGTLTVVSGGNRPPIALDDGAVTTENTSVLIDVLANDSDPDGDAITLSAVGTPGSGAAAIEGGQVRYTPAADVTGTDAFVYTVTDGDATATATVTVTIREAGAEPTTYTWTGAADGVWSTPGNWAPAGVPSAVDTALVGGGPDVRVAEPVALARLGLSGGRIRVEATLAVDALQVTGGDLAAAADVAVGALEWTGAVPSRISGSATVTVDGPATLAVQSAAVDGAALVLRGPSTLDPFVRGSDNVGSLALSNGARVEVAEGAILEVRATGDSEDTGEVSIVGVPGGARSRFVVQEGAVLRSTGPGVVGVAGDISLETAGDLALAAGEWRVRFAGAGAGVFTHTGTLRGAGALALDTPPALPLADHFVNGGVTAPGPGGALTVTTDYLLAEDPLARLAVALGDTPGAVDPLVVAGTVTLGGTLDVTLADGFAPSAGEAYEVLTYGGRVGTFGGVNPPDLSPGLRLDVEYGPTDGAGSVVLRVLRANTPPTAGDDVGTTDEDVAVTLAVLDNDRDADDDALTVTAVSTPDRGAASTDGTTVTYTPAPDTNGADAFTYTISDGNGGDATATVTVTVVPVNDPPVARDDAVATPFETAVTLDVRENDTDVDGDALTVVAVSVPTSGTASVGVGGMDVTYAPGVGFRGEDAFTYTVSDGNGGEASATVTVTVAPPNTAPEPADDAAITSDSGPVTIAVLTNDADVDGDPLAVAAVGTPASGTATTDGTTVTYTPTPGVGGTVTFDYTVADGRGGEATATVRVLVTQASSALTAFAQRGDFDTAAPGLAVQTFEAAVPGVGCAAVLDVDTDDACVDPGDILPGLRIEGETADGEPGRDGVYLVVGPGAGRSWTRNALLLNDIGGRIALAFPDGTAALGLDVHNFIAAAGTFVVSLFATDGAPLGTLTVDVPSEAPGFVGVTSSVPIGRAVVDEFPPFTAGGGAAEVIDAIAFVSPSVVPTVVTAPTAPPSAGTPSTVGVDLGGVVPITADLFYRVTGRTTFASVPLSLVGGRYQGEVPAAAVTPRGFDYYVRVSDGRAVVTDPAVDPEGTPRHVRVSTAPQAAAVATPRDGSYRMVSVPVALDDAAATTVFADDFGPYDPTRWRLLRWDPESEAYAEFGEPGVGTVLPGQGYWLAARGEGASPFDVEGGQSVDASAPVEITLPPGWSQIGAPFAFPVDWADVAGAEALPAPVGYDGVEYVPGQTVLEPWRGVFVENPTDTAVTIAVPPVESGEGGERRPGARLGPASYALRLRATAGDRLRDTHNVVGFAEGATAGRDVLDWGEPPPVGEFVALSVVEEGTALSRSLRPPDGAGGAWDLRLTASPGAFGAGALTVTLALEDLAPLPDGFGRYLLDRDRGAALAVVEGRVRIPLSLEQAVASLRVIVGTEAFARVAAQGAALTPDVFSLEPPRPNPSAGAVRIDYVVAEAGEVVVEVFDPVGRRVAVLAEGPHEPGVYAVSWAPAVAAGAYLVRLRSPTFHTTRPVAIVR